MKYKEYTEKNEDGTARASRKSRKSERRSVFIYNKNQHSKRTKKENKEAAQ